MGKIINGRRYNPDTATMLGVIGSGQRGSLNFYEERLYRTRSGAYFLLREGGLHHFPDAKSVIEPMTIAEAQKWAENHLDAEEYCAIFGEVEEAKMDNTVTEKILVSLSAKTAKRLRERSKKTGTTVSETVEYAVRKFLENEET